MPPDPARLGGASSARRSKPLAFLPRALRLVPASLLLSGALILATESRPEPPPVQGYYRFPALHGATIVFTAEGDLWSVGIEGGTARRLTSHPGAEEHASFSPDGATIAFSAEYEGPMEVYTMPASGGLPTRRTFGGGRYRVVGWTPDGKVLCATSKRSTLPSEQLVAVDVMTGRQEIVPLSEASEGVYDAAGTLFFTRFGFHGSFTKRYRGGFAQSLWKLAPGASEAQPLTADFAGTSNSPLVAAPRAERDGENPRPRLYFVSDRDGTMNLWSMDGDGGDARQETHHNGWDVKSPSYSNERIVYQLGADLRCLELATKDDRLLPIVLATDLDQLREHWVEKPMEYVTSVRLSPNGDRIALTARGQVFVAPVREGRFVEATRRRGVRYRQASFAPDGGSLLVMSDETGEIEFWKLPADGIGEPTVLTKGASVFRYEGILSPDGRKIAYHDKNQELWLYDLEGKKEWKIADSPIDPFLDLKWSPDSRWLAYVKPEDNFLARIYVYGLAEKTTFPVTTDRFNSWSPTWSPDGKWIYFLTDRSLRSVVRNPWGARHPEPFLDRSTDVYLVALRKNLRSPFRPPDELMVEGAKEAGEEEKKEDGSEKDGEETKSDKKAGKSGTGGAKAAVPRVVIDREGIHERIERIGAPSGNYDALAVNGERLFWTSREAGTDEKVNLVMLDVGNKDVKVAKKALEPKSLAKEIRSYELSADGKKILVRKEDDLFVIGADSDPDPDLAKSKVSLDGWTFSLDPREEWRQMFLEAWRLERDYFYDRRMHGIDWPAMREKYRPLTERITSRAELSDVLGDLIGELSALHHYVYGGEFRQGPEKIDPASLGAVLVRDEKAGGYRVEHIYRNDPDLPDDLSPLARPGVDVEDGDILETINGVALLGVSDPGVLLRNQAGRQTRLRVRGGSRRQTREVIAVPITVQQERELRYDEWEYTRRVRVEEMGKGEIGYVHLRSMGGSDYDQWARDFYPVFHRKGLIVDVRHNTGGNIESWILGRLMRKAWMWWQPRVGKPSSNMQSAFIGHAVVLCDHNTMSDGEAFAEGFRRLGIGKIIGTRTWGGEIWLTASNTLVDRGIATAAEFGVYGPEGEWLIEGHGVDPDIVVDNLPHATFLGKDAQLEAAVRHLEEEIRKNPVEIPEAPRYPDKSAR